MKKSHNCNPSELEHLGQALNGFSYKLEVVESVLKALKDELSSSISKLDGIERHRVSAQPAKGPTVVSGELLRKLQELSTGASQEQILGTLIEQMGEYVDRAIVFVEKGQELVPWRSSGLEVSDLQSISRDNESSPIARAASGHRMVYLEGGLRDAFPWFLYSEKTPGAAVCVPLVFEDTAPIVLYGDSEGDLDLDSIEVIVQWAGLVLKNNYLSMLVSREVDDSRDEPPLFQVEPDVLSGAMIEDEEMVGVVEPIADEEVEQTEDFLSQMSAAEAAGAFSASNGGFDLEAEPGDEVEAEEEAEVPERIHVSEASHEAEAVQAEPAGDFATPAEEKLHNEAHRFARLLVSEIKLYNEKVVEMGRAQGDLYERLNQDIERSREMYEKRAHPTVIEKRDYFHEELVRILAKGNEALLGNYRHHGTQPPAG